MTIGLIDVHKPEICEISDEGIEDKIADYYEFVVRECPKLDYNIDYKICSWSLNESTFNISNQGFGFLWNRIASKISDTMQLHKNCAIISSDALEKFGLGDMFVSPMFGLLEPLLTPLKPLLEDIKELPDSFNYEDLTSDDNDFFEDVVKWLKYWSIKAVELYDEDAYIEFT